MHSTAPPLSFLSSCPSGEKMEESQRFGDPKLWSRTGTNIGTVAACNKRPQSDCLRDRSRDLLSRARIIGHDQMPLMCVPTSSDLSACLGFITERIRDVSLRANISAGRLSILLARDMYLLYAKCRFLFSDVNEVNYPLLSTRLRHLYIVFVENIPRTRDKLFK